MLVESKFGIGDKVRVINYGSLMWDENGSTDILPELVGKEGLIQEVYNNSYSISGIKGKHAWYDEGQLEMVNRNPNR